MALSMNKFTIASGTVAFNLPQEVIPQLSVSLMFELRDVNVAFWHLLRQYRLVKCFFWKARTEYLSIYKLDRSESLLPEWIKRSYDSILNSVSKRIPRRGLYDRHGAKMSRCPSQLRENESGGH